MRRIISRPVLNVLPDTALPVHVRSAGYNEAEPGWSELEPAGKTFVQLFWCVQGCGEFAFHDRKELLHAGEVIYRLPGEIHSHRSAGNVDWKYHWFTMDGAHAADFFLSYNYPQTAMHAGACPVPLFTELESLLRVNTGYARRHAVSVAAEILARAGSPAPEGSEHDIAETFLDMAQARFTDPGLTAEALAEELGIHRTTLSRIVRKRFGFSPKQYIQQLRIQKGLSLLIETGISVKQAAWASGFQKADYFCEQIRKHTGLTPARYRARASADSL